MKNYNPLKTINEEYVPFNKAAFFYQEIHELEIIKDSASISDDLWVWYRCLFSIYRKIKFKFIKKKTEKFGKGKNRKTREIKLKNSKEAEYHSYAQDVQNRFDELGNRFRFLGTIRDNSNKIPIRNRIRKELESLEVDVSNLMEIKGMIFSKKGHRDGFDQIEGEI